MNQGYCEDMSIKYYVRRPEQPYPVTLRREIMTVSRNGALCLILWYHNNIIIFFLNKRDVICSRHSSGGQIPPLYFEVDNTVKNRKSVEVFIFSIY